MVCNEGQYITYKAVLNIAVALQDMYKLFIGFSSFPEEIHFFWTWQAELIVGLVVAWLLAFSTLACLLRTSIGKSLIDSLCPSLLFSKEKEKENDQMYFIILEGSPGMRRPSQDERFIPSEFIESLLQDDDMWMEEDIRKDRSTSTSNTVNNRERTEFEILEHRVIKVPKTNKEKFLNEGKVYPALRTSMNKLENTNLSDTTSVQVTSSGAQVALRRSSDIDIPFPCAYDPIVSVSESRDRFSAVLKVERKLSLIEEENINYNVE